MTLEAFDAMSRTNANGRAQSAESDVLINDDAPEDTSAPSVESVIAEVSNGIAARQSDDLQVPFEAQFGGRDYLPAPGLRRVALGLIMRDSALRHLTDQHVEYLWKRRGGVRRGVANIGECVMPSGLSKHAWTQMAIARTGSTAEQVRYVIWLSADHLEHFTPLQVEASLYRQLLKTGLARRTGRGRGGNGEAPSFTLRACDLVGFVAEVQRYGLWSAPLVSAAPAFARAQNVERTQQPSFDQLEAEQSVGSGPDPWGSAVADDGEEDEHHDE